MDKIYYQLNHLRKGQKAVKKLAEYSEEKPKVIKQCLSRQAFWQVHLPAPKRVDRPHYQVTTPNETHQFDLLYMPSDTLYGNKYKYILAGIDAASRFKVARLLRTKQARDMAEMIADIYKVGPLTYPSTSGDLRQGSSNNSVINFVLGFPIYFKEKHNPLLRTYYWWY